MEKTERRDYFLDNIRVVMILGIVFEHSLLIYGYPRSHEIVWAICISWLMPLFTMISGYLFKARSVKELCKRYLYPMILFSAVNFLIGYFFYPAYKTGFHWIGYAMWYLWALFIMAIITPLLQKLNYKIAVLLIAVALIYQLLPLPSITNYSAQTFQLNRIIGFYPFFALGILLRRDMVKIETMVSRKTCALALFAIACLYVIACWRIPGLAYKSGFYLSFSNGTGVSILTAGSYIAIVSICVLLTLTASREQKWYSKYGARTLNVYVLHMMVVFPLCYGMFAHLTPIVPFKIINSLLAVGFCLFFFSDYVDKIMKSILSKPKWGYVLMLYIVLLVIVNLCVIKHIIKSII